MDMSFDTKALGPLFELSPDAVLGIEDGVVLFSNPAAAALTGLREGDRADTVLPDEILSNPAERFSAACMIAGSSAELTVTRRDGRMLICIVDRSKQKPFPKMDRILAELGTGLASSNLAADALLSGPEEKRLDSASILYRSLYRLWRLHSHLMLADCILHDALPCRRRFADLRSICGDICDSVGQTVRSLGYTIRFTAPEEPCYAMLDPELIETMLLNLLTNSLLYTESGREIAVTLSVSGGRCVIAISDPGRGMDAGKLSSALGVLQGAELTDTAAGSGLGLFIARGIVEAHEGTLILESREGTGTSIRISLPHIRSDGLSVLSQPRERRHLSGMDPILTELSVFLDRSFYTENMFD